MPSSGMCSDLDLEIKHLLVQSMVKKQKTNNYESRRSWVYVHVSTHVCVHMLVPWRQLELKVCPGQWKDPDYPDTFRQPQHPHSCYIWHTVRSQNRGLVALVFISSQVLERLVSIYAAWGPSVSLAVLCATCPCCLCPEEVAVSHLLAGVTWRSV